MRTFEIIEVSIVALAVFVPVLFATRLKRGWMSLALVGSLVAQGVVEGFRWQLIPLHLAVVGLAIGDLIWEDRRVRGLTRFRRAVLGIPGVAVLLILPVALPIPELPTPTGAFDVGTMTFVITDPDREEIYGLPEPDLDATTLPTIDEADEEETPGAPRRIVVQAWYPTNAPDGIAPVMWNPDLDVVGPALARRFGFPGFVLDHTEDVRSSAIEGALPLEGRIPVVLYSHGWGGFRTIAIDQLESIASHGYLVLAADHTYGSVAVRFPDTGDVVYLDERALPDEETTDPDDYEDATEELVETFADDLILILDQLALGAEGDLADIAAAADLERIGLYGHSTGGGAAARVCLIDERCDAVAGLDAWVEPIPDRFVARELQIPSLFIRSDEWRERPNDGRLRGMSERSPAVSYWIGLEGAGHFDFVLVPSFSPVADALGLKGPIPSDRAITIIDDYLNAFFDRHLLGVGGALLDESPPPEVSIEVFE
jgi:pimeloyl-ACP methyl ester carboxylesterase